MVNSAASSADSRRLVFAVTYASVVGEYSLLVMPFIVGAMIDSYGASEQLAGRIVSIQMLGRALSAVGASVMMARLNKLFFIYAAAILVVLANLACALGSAIPMLIAARFATGVGEGALMAIAGSIAAGTADPRKAFSVIGFAVAVAASVALVLTPFLVDWLGRPWNVLVSRSLCGRRHTVCALDARARAAKREHFGDR